MRRCHLLFFLRCLFFGRQSSDPWHVGCDSTATRESLKFKLTGTKGGLETWGFEYVKNLAGEIGHEWAERKKDGKDTADLKAIVDEIVPFNVKHGSEPEACDLLMEVDLLPEVVSL